MLRSCYATKARFYEGDSQEDDIEWYWCKKGVHFLPVPSVINSLNWVDAKERIDTGHAGEVPGELRQYTKGERNIMNNAVAYCGSGADWLGHGTRPVDVPMSTFYIPICCNPENLPPARPFTRAYSDHFDSSIGGGLSGLPSIATSLPFDMLVNWPFGPGGPAELKIDLWKTNPNGSGTNDYLSDFVLADYPGYASQQWPFGSVNTYPDGSINQSTKTTPYYQATANVPLGQVVNGYVVSDNADVVLWWEQFTTGAEFFVAGDYLTFDLYLILNADYP